VSDSSDEGDDEGDEGDLIELAKRMGISYEDAFEKIRVQRALFNSLQHVLPDEPVPAPEPAPVPAPEPAPEEGDEGICGICVEERALYSGYFQGIKHMMCEACFDDHMVFSFLLPFSLF
jgi:hypothetical protein